MKISTTQEMLHALADNEVDSDDIPRLLEEIESSPQLQAELCEIRRVKDLVKHAYPRQPSSDRRLTGSWRYHIGKLAAVLFLVIGSFSLGWYQSGRHAEALFSNASVQTQSDKSIIFIGYSDKEKFKQTLVRAEQLLQKRDNPQAKVYVVASAGGIDLMRANVSPHQFEIKKMLAQHDSLHFVACNNTIYRYKKEGKPVDLIKDIEVAPSAVEFVAQRLNKGWNYISI